MPRLLSQTDISDFRERLCEVAERLFAERGMEAVTMRQLAGELGVSPMTPYRYFKDKDDILAAVRANGFDQLSGALETARASGANPRAGGAAVADAYISFAFEHPAAYKLMFDCDQPNAEAYPHLVAAVSRAPGDAGQIGTLFWAAAHGAVVLELAGKLPPGAARETHHHMTSALRRGLGPR